MTAAGWRTVEVNPPHHSIKQREKCGLARFDDCPAMGAKVPDVPHKASVNSIVIGNVRPTKAEGVIVTGMLRGGAGGSQQREQ